MSVTNINGKTFWRNSANGSGRILDKALFHIVNFPQLHSRFSWFPIVLVSVVKTALIVSALLTVFVISTPLYASVEVSALRAVGHDENTRFVADLSSEVKVRIFLLANPYRVVIDLPEARFNPKILDQVPSRGIVSGWRFGLFAPGRSRIVLDLKSPMRIANHFVLAPANGQPARLVVDLESTTKQMAAQIIARQTLGAPPAEDTIIDRTTKSDRRDTPKGKRKPVIVLDAGHGGIDSGAVGQNGAKEKFIVLNFAKRLLKNLRSTGRYDVHMVRSGDQFVSLKKRVKIAQSLQADLMISIHADSLKQNYVRGATVYTLSEKASDKMAAQIASQENKSDILAGLEIGDESAEVTDILLDLTRRETKNFSVLFARTLVDGLKNKVRLIKNPLRSAGFTVLKAHNVPSVLLEMGYLSNRQDEKDMQSAKWQNTLAERVVLAVDGFFSKKPAL